MNNLNLVEPEAVLEERKEMEELALRFGIPQKTIEGMYMKCAPEVVLSILEVKDGYPVIPLESMQALHDACQEDECIFCQVLELCIPAIASTSEDEDGARIRLEEVAGKIADFFSQGGEFTSRIIEEVEQLMRKDSSFLED